MANVDKERKENEKDDSEKPIIARTPYDLQRLKLEKLMKNPEKVAPIPERPKEKTTPHVPDFVRNVMGSSAGAGSGEFHVYRHLRRKEYARQKFIQEKEELQEEAYHNKIEANRLAAEERTAKKRAKRLKKKKKNQKKPKKEKTEDKQTSESESDESNGEDTND
ncbi:hypothetical protein L9F63_012055 [Diploptera punctata]|uniref:PRKR-interacting protein 1 n=1 Tax=Diploptera punctata TaxID=6984 RepID=A0AAD8ADA1_DIPPU|nr:hypothetical protein L9F63_012055 [Diploptera punctata]